ncbi:unnamed protein product [Spirodela intermedia]|uniref:Uncharacterized protein n=1 Tax=Spirodela intermedia TaxID=51605 RepID=A0A7I8JU72_SPIIN|nr:unnamed protein product [Spirodela intermedia]CAA6673281.1 unnamed protein product [Spirodela intermedia]
MVVSTSAFSEALVGNHPSAPRNSPSRAALPPSHRASSSPGTSTQASSRWTEMERRRRRRWAGVVRAVEEGVQRMVQVKDEEIASAARRSSALEDRLRVLAVEGQMWKKLARSSAASVAGLRRDIELASQAAAAWDGGEAEDSISCCEGGGGFEAGAPLPAPWALRRVRRGADSCPLCGGQKSATISVFL